jgi:hypothetical protein
MIVQGHETDILADISGFKRFGEWLLIYASAARNTRNAETLAAGNRWKESLLFVPIDAL